MKVRIDTCNESLLACLMLFQTVISSFHLLLSQLGVSSGILNYISFGVAYAMGVFAICRSTKNNIKASGLIYLVFCALVLLTYVFNDSMADIYFASDTAGNILLSNLLTLAFLYLPIFVLCASTKIDIKLMLDKMVPYAFINMLFVIVSFLVNMMPGISYTFEYMNFAYNSMFSIFICFYAFESQKKKKYLYCALAGVVCCFLGGSRGALVSTLLFLLLYILFGTGKGVTSKKLALVSVVTVFIVVVAVNFDSIVSWLNSDMLKRGYSSRLIRVILGSEGGFFHYGDRDTVQGAITEHAGDRIFGYGLFGDRIFAGKTGYSHNWLIEFVLDYGYFLGIVFIIAIIATMMHFGIKALKNDSTEYKFMWFIMVCLLFVKYMFSASYLQSREMMLIFGVLLSYMSNYKWNISIIRRRNTIVLSDPNNR